MILPGGVVASSRQATRSTTSFGAERLIKHKTRMKDKTHDFLETSCDFQGLIIPGMEGPFGIQHICQRRNEIVVRSSPKETWSHHLKI